MKKPLSRALKNFYGIGDFGFSLMTSVELYYFVFFMTNIAKFSLPVVALIGSVTSIIDAVLSPFYGVVISGSKAMKWGRLRSWMLLAPPLVVIFYMLNFSKIGPEPVAVTIVIVGYILAHIVWNIGWVANLALIPLLATTPEERGLLASRRSFYTALAGVFFSYIGIGIANFFGRVTGSQTLGYTFLAGFMALIMLAGYWVLFKLTDGYEPTGADAQATTANSSDRLTFVEMFRTLISNPYLIVLIIADFLRFMGSFIGVASVAYYFTYVAQNMALFPRFLLINAIAGTIGAYFSAPLMKKYSTRTTAIGTMVATGALMIFTKFIAMNVDLFFIFMPLAGLFAAMAGASVVGLYADVSVFSEWKTGKNASPFIMGLMNMSLKTAKIARSAVIPIVLAAAGFVAGADPSTASLELKNAVTTVYLLIPGLMILCCCAILTFGYKLNRSKLAGYQAELDARKTMTS